MRTAVIGISPLTGSTRPPGTKVSAVPDGAVRGIRSQAESDRARATAATMARTAGPDVWLNVHIRPHRGFRVMRVVDRGRRRESMRSGENLDDRGFIMVALLIGIA